MLLLPISLLPPLLGSSFSSELQPVPSASAVLSPSALECHSAVFVPPIASVAPGDQHQHFEPAKFGHYVI